MVRGPNLDQFTPKQSLQGAITAYLFQGNLGFGLLGVQVPIQIEKQRMCVTVCLLILSVPNSLHKTRLMYFSRVSVSMLFLAEMKRKYAHQCECL